MAKCQITISPVSAAALENPMPDTNATPPTVALPTHVELDRRKLLLTIGSFAAGTAATAGPGEQRAFAQSAQPASRNPMTDNTKIIDFHCHHIPARFELTAARYAPASQRARWEALARTLSDENLLLKDVRDGALAARVVSLLIQLIADAEGRVPHETTVARMTPSRSWSGDIRVAFTVSHRSMLMTATSPLERLSALSANSDCMVSYLSARPATCCSTRRRRALPLKSPRNLASQFLRIQ